MGYLLMAYVVHIATEFSLSLERAVKILKKYANISNDLSNNQVVSFHYANRRFL